MVRSLLPATACALVLTALAVHAPLAGQSTATEGQTQPQTEQKKTEAAARWERLQAEAAAERQARQEAQERYEKGVRDSEAAQREYEAATARHQAEVERSQREQAEYQRRLEQYHAQRGGHDDDDDHDRQEQPAAATAADTRLAPAEAGTGSSAADTQPTAAASESCERQTRRNRRRGRVIGGILGSVAGGVAGDSVGTALAALPVGAVIGDVIARMLNCDEQEQAAVATERAVAGGVGTTETWTSETRPNVTGSSTVLATETGPDGNECLTVTDVVIVDGEETRAPKRMCRQPPSNRFVRV